MPARRAHVALIALIALVALAPPAAAQLVDPGFETTTPSQQMPTTLGVWSLDRASTTGPVGAITPPQGVRMLSFDGTAPLCSAEGGTSGNVGQLFPIEPGFGAGDSVAVSVRVNRLDAPDADTQFAVALLAYDGAPATFSTGCGAVRPALDSSTVTILSDANPATWESLSTDLVIPEGATFLAVILSANENVNSTDTPAFDGHFADDVVVTFTSRCNDADLAPPLGVLDFSDVIAFLTAYGAMDPSADLAAPLGVFDFSDVLAFLSAFGAGCP